MKLRFLFSLMLGASLAAGAQGYQDGVDNYNAGRYEVAKTLLQKNFNNPTTDKAIANYYLGNIDLLENNVAGARAYYEKGQAANPEYPYNYIGLGTLDLKAGDEAAAKKLFEQAMKFDKKNTAVVVAVARAYWSVDPVKYKKEIEKYINKALKDSKNTESAVYILQGDMYLAEGRNPGEAGAQFDMAIMQDRENKGLVNREAYVKWAGTVDQYNNEAKIKRLQELVDAEPNSALALRELSEAYYAERQYGRALKAYEKYLESPNHFQIDEQRMAGLLFSAGEYQQSIDYANKVLAQDPGLYTMYSIIMNDYYELQDYPQAVEAGKKLFGFKDAQLLANDYVVYSDVLSKTDAPAEDVDAVIAAGIAKFPDDRSMKQGAGNIYFNYAAKYFGMADQAADDAEKKADLENSLAYYDKAIACYPTIPDYWYYRGIVAFYLYAFNNPTTAESFEKVCSIIDEDPRYLPSRTGLYTDACRMLALAYKDDPAKALEVVNKGLAIDPEKESLLKLRDQLTAQ